MLNPTKGNMYSFVTHTWNTVKGECPHGCHYCYMKKWGKQKPVRFDEKELKTDLGSGNFIFVGSSCDMFAEKIPESWIGATLRYCKLFDNTYLFQSKNPRRFLEWELLYTEKVVFGTTIESNIQHKEMGCAPSPAYRTAALQELGVNGFRTMVTIEPVMDFNLDYMLFLINACKPRSVNIGANTNTKVRLSEPSPEKINKLIDKLREITEVKIKPNLKRLRS